MELLVIPSIMALSIVAVVTFVANVWFRGNDGPEGLTMESRKK
jgi:hypothetical protein